MALTSAIGMTQTLDAPKDWRREAIWLSILYRVCECGDTIPAVPDTDEDHDREAFCGDEILTMLGLGFLAHSEDGAYYVSTDRAHALIKKLVGMYMQVRPFEIFRGVDIAFALTEEHGNSGDGGVVLDVFDNVYDPRFLAYDDLGREVFRSDGRTETVEDLRLAMLDWFAWANREKSPDGVSLHRVVFIQMLADGKLRSDRFWFDLRHRFLDSVEDVVAHAYSWRSLAGNPEEAAIVAKALYTAGMVEQRKRDGGECSECNTPLGVYRAQAEARGETLDACPNPACGAPIGGADDSGDVGGDDLGGDEQCPECGHAISSDDRFCGGCAAKIDRSLAPGSVETTTTTEVVGGWSHEPAHYGYAGYYAYNPWDPLGDALALGIICTVFW